MFQRGLSLLSLLKHIFNFQFQINENINILKIQFQVLTWLAFTLKFTLNKYFQVSISRFDLSFLFKININLIFEMLTIFISNF